MQSTPYSHSHPHAPSVLAPAEYPFMPPVDLNQYSCTNIAEVQSPGRRQRISMACGYCRRRKIKCGGGEPCGNCKKTGKACVYEAVPDEVNKATRSKKAASKAARAHAPATSYTPYPPPPRSATVQAPAPSFEAYTPSRASQYVTRYERELTVPEVQSPMGSYQGPNHRRTNSTPISTFTGQPRQQGFMSPNVYDAQGQDWQYPMNHYAPPPSVGYNGPHTQPMPSYQSMQYPPTPTPWTVDANQMAYPNGLGQMTSSLSIPEDLNMLCNSSTFPDAPNMMSNSSSLPEASNTMSNSSSFPEAPNMMSNSSSIHEDLNMLANSSSFPEAPNMMSNSSSIPDNLHMMGSSSSNLQEFNEWNTYTPSHGHMSLSADSTSTTFSSGPTLHSPNTPGMYGEMPQTFAPMQYGEQPPSKAPAPEYKAPQNNLVGLGISQQPQSAPTQLQPPFFFNA